MHDIFNLAVLETAAQCQIQCHVAQTSLQHNGYQQRSIPYLLTHAASAVLPLACESSSLLTCRLLVESSTANTLATAIDNEAQSQDLRANDDSTFSIAALQTTAGNTSGPQPPCTHAALLTALLQAAIACSANIQLSEQFVAADLIGTLTTLLDRGSVHNHQTSLAVELLWNLLDSCPVTDSKGISNEVKPDPGPRLQLTSLHREADLSAEAEVEEILPAEQAPDARLSADLLANASADLSQQGSAKWDFAAGSQELAAESDAADTSAAEHGLGTTGRSAARSLATTGRTSTQSPGAADRSAQHSLTGKSTMQSRHAASVKFNDIADDDLMPLTDDPLRSTTSPHAGTDPAEDLVPSADDSPQPPEDDSTADTAAMPTLTQTDIEPQAQQLATSLTRLFEDCLEHGYSQADKELRNTVLLVAGLLAESSMHRAALCQAGLLQTLLAVSTEPELQELTPAYFQVLLKGFRSAHLACASQQGMSSHEHDAVAQDIVKSRAWCLAQFVVVSPRQSGSAACMLALPSVSVQK